MPNCDVQKKNFGLTACSQLPQLIRGMITTPANFSLTEVQALVASNWQDAMIAANSVRIYYWPPFVNFENISEEAVYEDLPLAYLAVRDGNYRFRFSIKQSLCTHKAMFTHRANSGRVFLIDVENQIIGTLDSNGNIRGFNIQLLHTEKMIFSDGTVSTKSPIVVALLDNKELDESGVIFSAPFVNSLERIIDLKITIQSAADDEIVAAVTIECDGTAVNGLELADFVLLDANGDAQTISGVSENDGVYTLSGTGLESGTLGLAPVGDLSIQYYEATPVTVTIAS